jgi:lysophospholipase L1-like esterase
MSTTTTTPPTEESKKTIVRPKILLLGDSLTQLAFEGWGAQLANVYQRRADVVNRGCAGYNTRQYRLLPLEDIDSVCLTIIFFGANDAALPEQAAHQYVPVPEYADHLQQLIQMVRTKYAYKYKYKYGGCDQKNRNILLVTPPPIDAAKRLAFQIQKYGDQATGILERTNENTGLYAQACREVATREGLPCLDLYTNMQTADPDDWARFLNDGLHFSPPGHELVGAAVLEAIHSHFPDLAVTADPRTGQWGNSASECRGLEHQGPYHDQIDYKNPDKAFL